ncbi:hypothetical protein VTL71DRAFT_9988 [Oculimacula yallundae]|uniref:DUF5672 domain-containing protein n=1 Tax=Oculimacula yallundae TaxID=86028 RepID=A0ABR4BPY8_9HELO
MNSIKQQHGVSLRALYKVLFATLVFIAIATIVLIPNRSYYNILPSHKPSIESKNFAVIFDNRADPRLVPIILHFSAILGPGWPILLFTTSTFRTVSKSFHRKINDGSIQLRDLPSTLSFEKHTDVSRFMTTPWLWEQLAPAKHILFFQLDSILCSNSPFEIDDYLQYDFIGAPIQNLAGWGLGFNGGLSLRNLDKTLQIVRNNNWTAEVNASQQKGLDGVPILSTGTNDINAILPGHGNSPRIQYEDQWFFKKFMELPGAILPPLNVSKTFSVESMPYDTPFGYHKPGDIVPQQKKHLDEYCPEYILATSQTIIDA